MGVAERADVKGIPLFLMAPGANSDKLRLHVSEVGPGARSHPPHTHAGQEIFFVLQGSGEVSFGDEVARLKSGEAIQVDCRVVHGIRNAGADSLRYAVIIAP